ncbi:EndoU domain-containing protein [Kamptonema formosum]|uniref:EndoU domain-containing protein n=1 Tax=Kamptonema formosum TaxID=331992 RepID=UPI00037136E1|nr:EndoU domain-containing protein [Oscillatoria sp. PCC 10802]
MAIDLIGTLGILTLLWLGVTSCNQPHLASVSPNPSQNRPAVQASANLLPFFDRINNPVTVGFPANQKVDITPPPPQLNAFDRSVLEICGPIGTRVKAERFKKLLSDYPQVLRQVKGAAGELRPGRTNDAEFLDDLTAIWFNRRGFEHIFCGQIKDSTPIGGLHFAGRYLQLQDQGIAGRLPNNSSREKVIPGAVYSLGVTVKKGSGTVTANMKSYAYPSSALEILTDATKAFKTQSSSQRDCIYTVRDAQTKQSFPAIFVRDESGIITFFPDVKPKGKKCDN